MFKINLKRNFVYESVENLYYAGGSILPVKYQKKILKLSKNPKKFFNDSKYLKFVNDFISFEDKDSIIGVDLERYEGLKNNQLNILGSYGFDLIGENWLLGSEKKIAILWGFSYWKRCMVSRYLTEYRVAYSNTSNPFTLDKINGFLNENNDLSFIFWGMGEKDVIREYAVQKNISILRMEDGFIRSANLGSEHSTAMSLVLDEKGIYFNSNSYSDLEHLINEIDFSFYKNYLKASVGIMKIMRDLGVSKYNVKGIKNPSFILGHRIKDRVLVIGQVANDASLIYGNSRGWDDEKLLALAASENKGSEIIYKPHPDVAKGYRKGGVPADKSNYKILLDDVVICDLFKHVDRVYTITSLAGMEALIHGLPVTVVGSPFYSGWGLTDDRGDFIARRSRTLTLEELFCCAYLVYPRYFGSSTDPVVGCLSAIFSVSAGSIDNSLKYIPSRVDNRTIRSLCASEYWPALFRADFFSDVKIRYGKQLIPILSIGKIFSALDGRLYKKHLAYFVSGKILGDDYSLNKFLSVVRGILDHKDFSELVFELWSIKKSPYILSHWAWVKENSGELDAAKESLIFLVDRGDTSLVPDVKIVTSEDYSNVFHLAKLSLKARSIDDAEKLFLRLFVSGFDYGDLFIGLSEICRLKFEFKSAASLTVFYNKYNPRWKNGKGYIQEAVAQGNAGNATESMKALILACNQNPQYFSVVNSLSSVFQKKIGDLPYIDALKNFIEIHQGDDILADAKALILSEQPEIAEKLILSYNPVSSELIKYTTLLSEAYSYQGKMEESKKLILNVISEFPVLQLYREALRVAIMKNDYAWGLSLLKSADEKNLAVGDMYHRKVYLGLGDIKSSYASFREMKGNQILAAYFKDRYKKTICDINKLQPRHTLVIACFGPGDEIRFASKYREIKMQLNCDVTFTCDPRIFNLLKNANSELCLAPVARIRSLTWLENYSNYDQLPGSDLHNFLDNQGWDLSKNFDCITLVTDLLSDVIEDYSSFSGSAYMLPNFDLASVWRAQVDALKLQTAVVGISWRSTLTTYSRNEHYLEISELAPLFELEGVTFVNFQYDECSQELQWIEERYPGKIIHFAELDQFNDLEGVAALMCCMDLMISPATTVVELAGAVGVPTLLVSNSSELHWRKKPGTVTDVWHNSIQHVEGSVLGNKASVVEALVHALKVAFHQ